MSNHGSPVVTSNVGLIINPSVPHLGGTPDQNVYDVLEHDLFGHFCLVNDNGKVRLNSQHNYFYHIQGQMALSSLKWCDYVVYTRHDEVYVERVRFSEELWVHKMSAMAYLLQFILK